MLKRKIEKELLDWKNSQNHKPLIIKGIRQCGKTFVARKFADENYENIVYINFFQNPEYASIFSGSLEVDNLITMISAFIPGAHFVPGKTVIILDEIQDCSQARTALKFFHMDGRFDVVATGSLLGVKGYGKAPASIPVGYEKIINMYPLDFEEFLWAKGITPQLIDMLKISLQTEQPVPEALHIRMKNLLLEYTVVGGMPDAVNIFLDTHNLGEVLEFQRNLIASYEDDMVKYAPTKDKAVIKECFKSIPKQLAKENKKFQYSLVKKGSTASKFAGAIEWIEDAGITCRCYNLSITELPLDGNAIEDIFKIYMSDTGLFIAMLEDGTQADIMSGNLLGYKGAIFENIVADFFHKMGRKLYYFHKDSGLEIDFVMRYKGECTLVEVKANTGNTKSTKTVLKNYDHYHVKSAIKLGNYNVGRQDQILTLPLYMGFLLNTV